MDIDELSIYRGQDYKISDHITVHQPTLEEICNYGELKYFNMIYTLTSVGADLKWQLDEIGVDYTKIDDFELFYNILIKSFSLEQTSIIFGDLDFSKFQLYQNTINGEMCLVQDITLIEEHEKQYNKYIKFLMKLFRIKPMIIKTYKTDRVILDGFTYHLIVNYLRKIHGLNRNNQVPANESTKRILIEDAKDEYERNKNKEVHSQLLNLISTMTNSEGFKFNYLNVWDIKINAFMDSVRRISKIKNAELLLQSGYSGNGISLKDIDNKQIDWLGELD